MTPSTETLESETALAGRSGEAGTKYSLIRPKQKQPEGESWFKFLGKTKKLACGREEMKLEVGKEETLVSFNRDDQLFADARPASKRRQTPANRSGGVSLLAQLHISADRLTCV